MPTQPPRHGERRVTPPIAGLATAVKAARDIRAMARRAGRGGRHRSRVPAPRLRFPCGHLEGRRAVSRRLRTTARAAWIQCRSCNVVALVVARGGKAD